MSKLVLIVEDSEICAETLQIALELVERKIDCYDQILRRAQVSSPPAHRPSPRKVRIRPAS